MKSRGSFESRLPLSIVSGLIGLTIAEALNTSISPAVGFLIGFLVGLVFFSVIVALTQLSNNFRDAEEQSSEEIEAFEAWKTLTKSSIRDARHAEGERSSGS